MFNLNASDLLKGAVVAVLTALLTAVAAVVLAPNFDVLGVDWVSVLHNMLNIATISFVGYLVKNLISDNQGKVLGRIG